MSTRQRMIITAGALILTAGVFAASAAGRSVWVIGQALARRGGLCYTRPCEIGDAYDKDVLPELKALAQRGALEDAFYTCVVKKEGYMNDGQVKSYCVKDSNAGEIRCYASYKAVCDLPN